MRKNYFLRLAVTLLCPILLWSCSKEENPEEIPEVEENKTLLSVTLAPNYFPEIPDVEYSGAVYLTNEEGEVISSGELKNGFTTELQEVYDSTENLNLSFIKKIEHPGGISYRISTYTNIDPYLLSFENPLVRPRMDKASVQILNTGSQLQYFIYNYPSYSGSVSDNEATFDIRLNQEPDDLFFTVRKETEDFKRYFLLKNATAETDVSLDFQELTPFTNQLTMNFPGNSFLFASIKGAESTELNNFFAGIDEVRTMDGRTSHIFAIPEDLFQRYKLLMVLRQDQKEYRLEEKTTSIEEQYDFPDWDLQFSTAGTEYSFTSTNAADFYSAGFQYLPTDQAYDIVWTIAGKKSNKMSFNLPDLQEFIARDFANFNLEDLTLRSAELIRIEGISNYKEFIMAQEDNFSSEKETITRSENLVNLF